MKVVQTKLSRKSENGIARLVAWLPAKPNVRVGSVVSLDGDGTRWKVEEQWATQDSELINMRWGLALPPSQRTER
jgi:hypothetical protein